MTDEERCNRAEILQYYWRDHRDLERFGDFDRKEMEENFPELLRAWGMV